MYLVAGDSWGCGEWVHRDPSVVLDPPRGNYELSLTHRGLAEFLEQHDTVVNISKPGAGNFDILQRIRLFLDVNYNCVPHIKKIFVFQTSWWRDFLLDYSYCWLLDSDSLYRNFESKLEYVGLDIKKHPLEQLNVDNLNDLGRTLTTKWYKEANKLAEDRGVEMVVIGGLSDCLLDFPDLNHLKFGCRSMINLSVNGEETPESWRSGGSNLFPPELLELVKKLWPHTLDKNIRYLEQFKKTEQILKSRTDLFPDQQHGNRICHKNVYDLLVSKNLL